MYLYAKRVFFFSVHVLPLLYIGSRLYINPATLFPSAIFKSLAQISRGVSFECDFQKAAYTGRRPKPSIITIAFFFHPHMSDYNTLRFVREAVCLVIHENSRQRAFVDPLTWSAAMQIRFSIFRIYAPRAARRYTAALHEMSRPEKPGYYKCIAMYIHTAGSAVYIEAPYAARVICCRHELRITARNCEKLLLRGLELGCCLPHAITHL